MNFWDAHCHLLDQRLDETRDAVVARALESGITRFWLGGYDPTDWLKQKQFADKIQNQTKSRAQVITAFGLHPWWVARELNAHAVTAAADLPQSLTVALAALKNEIHSADSLGELGLDFHPRRLGANPVQNRAGQERVFTAQLEIAYDAGKPLVLHIVRAHPEALRILTECQTRHAASTRSPFGTPARKKFRGLVHSFGADLQTARGYLALGLTPSISASAFADTHAALQTRKALQALDLSEFVIETDSPDQGAPFTATDQLNEPRQILKIAHAVGEIKSTTAQKVLEASAQNLLRIIA